MLKIKFKEHEIKRNNKTKEDAFRYVMHFLKLEGFDLSRPVYLFSDEDNEGLFHEYYQFDPSELTNPSSLIKERINCE